MMPPSADLLVVGLGAVGSATLYQAVKAGARVVGIDQFHPPHDRGSSHGETRITRQAIGEGPEFVPLVLRSNQIWDELKAATGRNLFIRNGALILAPPALLGEHHGSSCFLQDTIAAALHFHIAHEVLNREELSRRFPQFRPIQGESAYYEPGAGFLRPEACIETQLELASKYGATIRTGETVWRIRPLADHVEVTTDKQNYQAAKAVLTPGPWIGKLLRGSSPELFKVYRQVMHWFALAGNHSRYTPDNFPVFIWITGATAHDMMYGFPAVDGPWGGMKVATERYDADLDPDEVPRQVAIREADDMYVRYLAPRLPDVSSQCLRSATCLYTVTPNARFVVDNGLDSERVLFASACSGHGFKHSAALGEGLADLALDRATKVDLMPFRLDRLTREDPAGVRGHFRR